VLDVPREDQDAFQVGQVSLVQACKVASLPADAKGQIVADLTSGTDPAQAVDAWLAGRSA
jgi:hypothetical protein